MLESRKNWEPSIWLVKKLNFTFYVLRVHYSVGRLLPNQMQALSFCLHTRDKFNYGRIILIWDSKFKIDTNREVSPQLFEKISEREIQTLMQIDS